MWAGELLCLKNRIRWVRMKNNPLVSVVIPTYNSEKTFVECIESIKNQTYMNVEIIVVDNFSSDKTNNLY